MRKATMGFMGSVRRFVILLILLGIPVGLVVPALAQQSTAKPDTNGGLHQIEFLLGEWIGEGGGSGPGQGTGGFTFSYDLQNTVMVRKNYAEYPASADKPAYRHDDLMIIYQTPGDTLRAIYFDNEGHVINYTVDVAKDGKSAILTSAPSEQGARYRLTYALTDKNNVSIDFEIAPPGQPDSFSTYVEARAHRK